MVRKCCIWTARGLRGRRDRQLQRSAVLDLGRLGFLATWKSMEVGGQTDGNSVRKHGVGDDVLRELRGYVSAHGQG